MKNYLLTRKNFSAARLTRNSLSNKLRGALLGFSTLVALTGFSQTTLINPAAEGGFELGSSFASNGWSFDNTGVTNQWYVGTVPTGLTNNSAYISGDAGVTNGYSNTAISVAHFWRDITFPAGETQVQLSFNWKALGETGFWDALIVSIAPTSYTPAASTTSLGTGNLGAPTIELGRFWTASAVTSATISVPVSVLNNCSSAATWRLIFTWKNDNSGGSAPSAAVDNISLTSQSPLIAASGGVYTIDNTLPTGGTNFASFTAAINNLNSISGCLTGGVTFNVTAGQTFNELPPVITATGTSANQIVFQRSGAGANPVITSTGTTSTTEGSIVISGGDYFTFDGIDINNSASSAMEYGYIVRNASATDGAMNNTLKNFTVMMNRAVTTSSSVAVVVSSSSTYGSTTPSAATGSCSNNIVRDFTINGAVNGIALVGGTSTYPDNNNQVTSSSVAVRNAISNIGTTNTSSMVARGIYASNQSNCVINNNDVSGVTSYTSTAQGIFITGSQGTSFVTGNKVMAVSNSGSTSNTSVAYGIQAQNATSGTNVIRIANNMVSNIFTAFTGSATASRYAIGIHTGVASAASTQSYEVYNNSVSVGSGLTPTYSTTCYEIQNVAAVYKVRGNIFANFTNTQTGAARHYAWVTTSATSIGASGSISDNNDLYVANDAGTTGFIGRANATEQSTLLAWTTAITGYPGTDANSTSIDPMFVSNLSDLHLNLGLTPSRIESGAPSLGITADIDGEVRPGPVSPVNGGSTAPDMGADEFDGVPLPPPVLTFNSITPGVTAQCTATARLVSVDVSTPSGTVTNVTLGYAVNGTAQTPVTMTLTSGTNTSGTWQGTIPVPTPANATITWSVAALNSNGQTATYNGTSYSDEPLTGVTASATASSSTICAGDPVTLTASLNKAGTVTIGTGTSLTGATSQPTAFCNRWASYRMQTVFTAAELTAAGLAAGPITAMSFNISTLGDASTNANFVVKIGNTAQTSFTDFVSTTGYTTVYPAATYTHAVGVNTITFSTPFIWNGTSNIVIEVSHDGADLTNNSQTFYTPTAANTVVYSINGATTGTTSVNRLNVVLAGNTPPAIQAISWSDGSTAVATTNPATVNPTVTTTYTASITASGCTVAPSPTVTVNANPLPSIPTATNSSQCGTAVPTASVASTSGLPTPTFNWYTAATGGAAVQSSTSTTYTSNVASTTTFYVSELNTVTGCESNRVAVTVNVTAADPIAATATPTTICIGSSVTLSGANTASSPVQNYTYSWTGTSGSGLSATPVNGASISVTPTAPGTYTYDLNAADGGCTGFAQATITVDPFATTVTAVNVTCNGYNNGSFTLSGTTCGTPAQFSVDGGAFTSVIPTDLTPGSHTVIVRNTLGYDAASQVINISEPSIAVAAPAASNVNACQNALSVPLTATVTSPSPLTVVVGTNLTSDGTGPNNYSASIPELPSGAVVTGTALQLDNIASINGSWLSEIRVATSGATTLAATQISTTGSSGTIATYSQPLPNVTAAGGNVTVTFTESYNDGGSAIDATFGTVSLVVTYTLPTTVSWYDMNTGGSNLGTGSPFEAAGTSVLPNTTTPGSYLFYAQTNYGSCSVVTRTPVTVTVNALPTVSAGTDQTVCAGTSVTLSGSGATSYVWNNGVTNGVAFTPASTQTYTVTGTDGNGCQNTDQVVVTVNQPTSSTQTAAACVSYIWAEDGMTYTSSGTYTHLAGLNAAGCDSTVILNLTINQPTTAVQTVSACESYTWAENGTTYFASGSYTHTIVGGNSNGCDSTITLNLTINVPTTATVTVSSCSSYIWAQNGTLYTVSGMYNDTIVNAAGCDSIVTLDLTITQPTASTQAATACSSYTWAENGTTYNASGAYTHTLVNAAGCDSVITLNLTIIQPTTSSVTASACGSYTWSQNGMTYTASGAYTDTLMNAVGCDSVITLNLTIQPVPVATATLNNYVLTASSGATYQWIDCTTGTAIAGETAQTYSPSANGVYAVIVSNAAGCSDTSACVNVTGLGVKELSADAISIFPNPTHNAVTVVMTVEAATVEVRDAAGKLLNVVHVVSGDKVDLSDYQTGVYFLNVKTENGSSLTRVVKD